MIPEPVPEGPVVTPELACPRTITLVFRKSMVMGRVLTPDGPTACIDGIQVDVERQSGGEWKMVRTTKTSATGGFRQKLPNAPGKYRATTPEVVVEDETFPEVSSKAKNYHPGE